MFLNTLQCLALIPCRPEPLGIPLDVRQFSTQSILDIVQVDLFRLLGKLGLHLIDDSTQCLVEPFQIVHLLGWIRIPCRFLQLLTIRAPSLSVFLNEPVHYLLVPKQNAHAAVLPDYGCGTGPQASSCGCLGFYTFPPRGCHARSVLEFVAQVGLALAGSQS